MIIVWSGFGFVTVLIAFGFGALGEAVLQPAIVSLYPTAPATLGMAVGLLVAAGANWYLGKYLNTQPGRELIDPKTNQKVVLRRRHSLFWIPIEFFSALLLVLAVFAIASPASFDIKTPPPHSVAS